MTQKDPQLKKIYQSIKKEKNHLQKNIADKIFNLATAALSLVAALAWNDAIKSIFEVYFPAQEQIFPKIWYALVVTILAVTVTYYLGKLAGKENEAKDKSTKS